MFLGTALYYQSLFDVLYFFSWILCLCPQDSFLFHGRIGVLTAEQNIHSAKNANLPVSGLKKMKGGLIIFFFSFACSITSHELGEESVNI